MSAANHTDAFEAFRARRREAEADVVKVTWRRVSSDTGGGYSGLGPGGLLVYVDCGPGVCTYGHILRGGHRLVRGTAASVTEAKLAAARLFDSEDSLYSGLPRTRIFTDAERKKRSRPATRRKENQMARAAAAAEKDTELKELHSSLLGRIKEAAKGSKTVQKKSYARVTLNGKTVAYVTSPGRKAVTVSVPRADTGYEEMKVATAAEADKALGVVSKRVEVLAGAGK